MFHKHRWTIVNEWILKSAYEQIKESGMINLNDVCAWVFKKKLVVHLKCADSNCQKSKIVEYENP